MQDLLHAIQLLPMGKKNLVWQSQSADEKKKKKIKKDAVREKALARSDISIHAKTIYTYIRISLELDRQPKFVLSHWKWFLSVSCEPNIYT